MPDKHAGSPLGLQADLAIWSLVAFLVVVAVFAVAAVCWYGRRSTLPIAILSVATVIGLLIWPVLAIVGAVLLAGLIVSTALRTTPLATHSDIDDQPSPVQPSTSRQQSQTSKYAIRRRCYSADDWLPQQCRAVAANSSGDPNQLALKLVST